MALPTRERTGRRWLNYPLNSVCWQVNSPSKGAKSAVKEFPLGGVEGNRCALEAGFEEGVVPAKAML